MRATFPILVCAILLSVLTSPLDAQIHLFGTRKPKPTPQPVRKASEFISRQAPVKVNKSFVKQATLDNTRIVVAIPKQLAYRMIGHQVVADGPISSVRLVHDSV